MILVEYVILNTAFLYIGASRTVQQKTIQGEASHASTKRKASEASTSREGQLFPFLCIHELVFSNECLVQHSCVI